LLATVDAVLTHPIAKGGVVDAELTGDLGDRPTGRAHQVNRIAFELGSELAPAPSLSVFHADILLSREVSYLRGEVHDGLLLCGQPLRIGVLSLLQAPQARPLGRGTVGQRLAVLTLGGHHRPLVPAGTTEQPTHCTRLSRSEGLPLRDRKRLSVLTGIQRWQVHRALELCETGPWRNGQRRRQQRFQFGDPPLQLAVTCISLSDPPPLMQCLALSLNSGRLPLGREALLFLQPQLLLLKPYPLLLNLELSLQLPRDRLRRRSSL
jgi:hypothetical protein